MPLRLKDFLVSRIDLVARIEDDAVYARWPGQNRDFLGSLESAVRAYLTRAATRHSESVRWPLTKLRAQVARAIVRGVPADVAFCIGCRAPVVRPHPEGHGAVTLLRLAPNQQAEWFVEFIAHPRNTLDAVLVATDGPTRLMARTHRGDFGSMFHRRWLRHRARHIAALTTADVRRGVEHARRQGIDLDFVYDQTCAVFVWEASRRSAPR